MERIARFRRAAARTRAPRAATRTLRVDERGNAHLTRRAAASIARTNGDRGTHGAAVAFFVARAAPHARTRGAAAAESVVPPRPFGCDLTRSSGRRARAENAAMRDIDRQDEQRAAGRTAQILFRNCAHTPHAERKAESALFRRGPSDVI